MGLGFRIGFGNFHFNKSFIITDFIGVSTVSDRQHKVGF